MAHWNLALIYLERLRLSRTHEAWERCRDHAVRARELAMSEESLSLTELDIHRNVALLLLHLAAPQAFDVAPAVVALLKAHGRSEEATFVELVLYEFGATLTRTPVWLRKRRWRQAGVPYAFVDGEGWRIPW